MSKSQHYVTLPKTLFVYSTGVFMGRNATAYRTRTDLRGFRLSLHHHPEMPEASNYTWRRGINLKEFRE
jgi:hypothetical protein